MQNSLDRLLGGIAEILAAEVESEVADPWVRSQVTAAAELLRQLAVRVTWDVGAMPWLGPCREAIDRAVEHEGNGDRLPAVLRAQALGPVDGLAAGSSVIEAYVAAHLEALSELAVWSLAADGPSAELVAVIRAAVDAQAETERALVRSAA